MRNRCASIILACVQATSERSPSPSSSSVKRQTLTREIYALFSYLMRMANVGTFNMIAELDLSFTQLKALCALEMDGEERSVKALATSMGVSMPAMSRAVEGLFERGFVAREEDPLDRRMKRVRLTPAGRTVPKAFNEARLSVLEELMSSLDDEEARALERALVLIVERREEIAAYMPTDPETSR